VYASDPDRQSLASRADDGTVTRSGGAQPGRIVLARRGGPVLRYLSDPALDQHDRSPVLGPIMKK
jgi:hypothetical protein